MLSYKTTVKIQNNPKPRRLSKFIPAGTNGAGLPTGSRKIVLGLGLAIVGIAIIASAALWPSKNTTNSAKNAVPAVDSCESSKNVTFGCYKNLLVNITQSSSPKQAFTLVKQQYGKVPYVKSQCHQLAHVIGKAALSKFSSLTETFAQGDRFCWSGYYHGAMEQVAEDKGYDYIVKNANQICAPIAAQNRNSFYHYNCVHGLGHGFMMVQNGELFSSLKSCDSIKDDWERQSCYGGVFMQNIMNFQGPDANPNQPPKYLKANEPMYPCTAIESKYKFSCYQMQTSFALQTVNYDFSKGFSLCNGVETQFKNTCFESLGRDASGSSNSDITSTRNRCLLGTDQEARKSCLSGAAKDFVSYFNSDQQALQLCDSLDSDLKEDCRQVVQNYYSTF